MHQIEKGEWIHGAAGVVDEQGQEGDIQEHDNYHGLIYPVRLGPLVMGQKNIAHGLEDDYDKDY